MGDTRRPDGRRRSLAAAAVGLAVAGTLTTGLALRGAADESPVEPPRTVTAQPGTGPGLPGGEAAAGQAPERGAAGGLAAGSEAAAAAEPEAPTAAEPEALAAPAAAMPDLGPILPASDPVGIEIPSIGVDEDVLERLEVGPDGVLAAPVDFDLPGWHTRGPRPGQLGPSVIAGHVDGPDGPAVFHQLGRLAAGDLVHVTRQDGTVATFVIDSVERYAKAEFPTSRVYGNTTDRAEIRLITCGGVFDRATGHYVDNVVAFGHLV